MIIAGGKKKGGHIRSPIVQFDGNTNNSNNMNVLTKYPIKISSSESETHSEYNRTYAGFNGLQVTTKYPIVTSTSDAETLSDYRSTYSAASGAARRARRAARRRRGDSFGQRTERFFGRALQNPFVQNVLGQKLGVSTDASSSQEPAYVPEPQAEKKGMSTGAKVGIAIGVVAVLGAAAYFLTKK